MKEKRFSKDSQIGSLIAQKLDINNSTRRNSSIYVAAASLKSEQIDEMRPFEVVYQEAPILENQEEDVQSG